MGLSYTAARAISAVSTWGLKNVFRRPAANFPGKIALYVDPAVIGHAKAKLRRGSVAVVGTNGKTTVTNLLADVLEQAGGSVVCNRTGANLDSGVATALLHADAADWGVFESDELWLAKILPQLKADYVLLLNLFRDQLDRCGEIDRIQDSIVRALASSPKTVLVYNADDPLCATIAARASEQPGRADTPSIAFGVREPMGLAQNTVTDATMCQTCSTMFQYAFRQYGQLGEYHCPNCGFARPALDFAAEGVQLDAKGLAFDIVRGGGVAGRLAEGAEGGEAVPVMALHGAFNGAYMVYNLLATGVMASLLGCGQASVQRAVDAFDPRNGRLQAYEIGGRKVLLNLAKNPTGFNQNLKIVAQDEGRPAVAFFINDKEADGHDVSWLWDIDFEELAHNRPVAVYAGGIRGADMAVRLKYADITADRVASPQELLSQLDKLPRDVNAYVIANYTSLPGVKAALDAAAGGAGSTADAAERGEGSAAGAAERDAGSTADAAARTAGAASDASSAADVAADGSVAPVVIAHLFPDLLNLYGDGGNVRVLEQRLRWRGVPVEVRRVNHGDSIDLAGVDVVMMGGSPDREQRLASADLLEMADDLREYVESGGPLLAICGSYQMLGRQWLLDGEEVAGLGIIPMTTGRPGTSADRLTSNIVLRSPLASEPVVGYENHAGRTYLDDGVQAFGEVVSSEGCGNNEQSKQDGVLYKGLIGTYLHGPLLAKNPQVADELLRRALERHAARVGGAGAAGADVGGPAAAGAGSAAGAAAAAVLAPLDDAAERQANAELCQRFVR
ncbi:DUF1727 domain-containing protein [Eggerthellaceae bacterium zg-887]|uniref:MurT ligase domain-containing protein n=1 Tax=Xiamenia xianingshaonis TaxID=2682776 RepID=UPI00140AC767|nr:MurT ligase domain-containing protein [Xiamenia xianingshaonis]NHM15079.1 DUF1727 domain-containing protein [Xiamenia xianingshaonis]